MPSVIRDAVTDYLRMAIRVSDTYGPMTSLLTKALLHSRETTVIDLCAGGGGPWQALLPALRAKGWEGTVTLTDRFPNFEAMGQLTTGITYSPEPVDARSVPKALAGFRTLFTAFHHFRPADARAILLDAAAKDVPIALFEGTKRSPAYIAAMVFSSVAVLVLTPFIRPFTWSRLFFTYVIPLVPAVVTWDGIVSCLRTYTVAELNEMTRTIPGNYQWEVGEVKGKGLLPLTYLFGLPRR